jgi:chromosome partitioning protein
MAHRVLTVCGLKGGIGKSAVATNLAAWWSAAGQRVLLIDADPNGSATKLHARGEGALLAAGSAVAPIQQAPMAMAKPWDLVVVDTAGGSRDEQRTYAEGSDFVVAPCQPAASSIEQVMDLAEILKATGVPFGVVLTMCDTRRKVDAIKTRQVLERVGLPVLRLRSRCSRHGRKPKPLALPCAMHAPTPTGQTPVPLRHGSRWQTLPPKSKPS